MRIVKLSALNINSLKGKTEIDFEKFLNGDTLFAITGETGSGKSTLLDIISCALYGKTPRLSNPKDLMSRGEAESFCEVEFETEGKRYRSSWSIHRARKRADGNFQTPKMELAELESGKILATNKKVPEYIETLIGLDFDRFTKSILLAQGAFDAFLKAKDKDRSVILEKLSDTTIYREISKRVYEKFSDMHKRLEIEESKLEGIEVSDEETILQKEQEKERYLKRTKVLQNLIDCRAKEFDALKEYQTLSKDLESAKKQRDRAIKRKEEQKDSFKLLQIAQKAYDIESQYIKYTQKTKELQSLQRRLDELNSQIDTNLSKQKELIDSQKIAKESFESYQKIYSIEKAKIDSAKELNISRDTQKSNLNSLKVEYQNKKKQKERLSQEIAKLSQEIEPLQERRDELEKQLREIENRLNSMEEAESSNRDKKSQIEKSLITLQEIESIREQIQKWELSLESKLDTLKQKQEILNTTKNLIESLNDNIENLKLIKKYQDDRKKLIEGKECPLCGATHHPKAKQIDENIDKELNKRQKELKENSKRYQTLLQEIATLESESDRLNSDISQAKERVKKLSQTISEDNIDTLKKDLDELNKFFQELDSIKKQRRDINSKFQKIDATFQTKKSNLIEQEKSLHSIGSIDEVEKKIKSLDKEIETLNRQIYELIGDRDISEYQKEIDNNLKSKERAVNEIDSLLKSIEESINRDRVEINRVEIEIKKSKKDSSELKKSWIDSRSDSGFESDSEFERYLIDKEELNSLNTLCSQIDKEIEDSSKKIEFISNSIEQIKLPQKDITTLETIIDRLTKKRDSLSIKVGELNQEIKSLKSSIQKYKKQKEKIDNLKREFEDIALLNSLIGSSNGDKFSKFAQGITLDYLISLANIHLKDLSQRYLLHRKRDKELDFEVIDLWQGDTTRDINTLSGGESFLVSLSLALALSQMASQKIRIDSLFLDEGFGTLDSNTLNIVLEALNRLQSQGKIIGVISHVNSLKEAINHCIEIEKIGGGISRVKFDIV